MSLYHIIKKLHPTIQDSDFSIQNDGEGDYIKTWTFSEPAPTEEQLPALLIAADKFKKLAGEAEAANDYLLNTDYLALRVTEGYSLPAEIKQLREKARQSIRDFRKFKID